MSCESIDLLWNESIASLKKLAQEEEDLAGDNARPATSIDDAFRHFARLYVRYTVILSDLNECHSASVQPQKRLDIRSCLERVILRVINLRHLLVKWCPPNADVLPKEGGGSPRAPFPWEYFDLRGELAELSIPPSRLEASTPAYFEEDGVEAARLRDRAVAGLLRETSGTEVTEEKSRTVVGPSVASAQARSAPDGAGRPTHEPARDALSNEAGDASSDDCDDSIAEEESDDGASSDDDALSDDDASSSDDGQSSNASAMPEHEAAARVQSIVRGYLSRKETIKTKRWLDSFLGLRACGDTAEMNKLESNLTEVRRRRKKEQQYCKESYENDLHRLKDVVIEEEGFGMQCELREERIKWITEHTISKNVLPDSFKGFYESAKDAPEENKENERNQGKKKDGMKGKVAKGKGAKNAKGKGKKSKDKKSAGADEVELPVLAAHPTLTNPIRDCIRVYEERWQHRNLGPGRILSQYHDIDMAKDLIIRDQVKKELTKGVEETLLSNILKIKAMQDANNTKKSKSKKGGKGKGKGKGKKGKGKKVGKKKEKPLPGAKLMKGTSVEEMLGVLVRNGLVSVPKERNLKDFIGGFENGRPKIPGMDKQERWIPDDPSAFQLRKAVMDYCILPLGSTSIKSSIQESENVRSILFYGPSGSGKSLMVETIASEIGALWINISSSAIGTSFGGKEGATKLIHMAFTIARESAYAPVIIYLDDCHEFFMGKSKKKGGAGQSAAVNTEMQRFQKDLLVYKNQSLKKEDRVIVIGCTSMPEIADTKLLRWKGSGGKPEKQGFFERFLYFPRASHADRAMLWRTMIRKKLETSDVDNEVLAFLSEGFKAGEISSLVDSALSEERLRTLSSKPVSEQDFSRLFPAEAIAQDDGRFLTFTRQITNLDSVWKNINGSVDKKSGGGKKKK